MPEALATLVFIKNYRMKKLFFFAVLAFIFASCKPTKKIQTAIAKRDTVTVVTDHSKEDTMAFISKMYAGIQKNYIDFNTFSAKVDVDYVDGDDKKYNVNANIRMQKDSAIWVSITVVFGIEGLRALITKDEVKILDKNNKTYTVRSIKFLQDVTSLPLDLRSLQDLLIGNPVFLDSNIVSYSQYENNVSLLSLGEFFKNLITISQDQNLLLHSKLDDANDLRSRTCDLTYDEYENKKGFNFATVRKISVTETKRLDIKLNYKQYSFNEVLTFPFTIPKNYKTN